MKNNKGAVIAAVVIFMLVFSIMGTVAIRIFMMQALLNNEDINQARIFYASDAAVEIARAIIVNNPALLAAAPVAVFDGDFILTNGSFILGSAAAGEEFDDNFPLVVNTARLARELNPDPQSGWVQTPNTFSGVYLNNATFTVTYYILQARAWSTVTEWGTAFERVIQYRFAVRTLDDTEYDVPVGIPATNRKFIFRSWREM